MDLNQKTILITGGTGSFGKSFIRSLLKKYPAIKRIIVFSRDEQKHFEMMNEISPTIYSCMQYLLGDVRDRERVIEVSQNVDVLIHAAAMKHVPAAEMNPMECVKTNIMGSQHVIDAAMINNVKVVVALSSDKAVAPVNFYGASKLCLEKLFTHADLHRGNKDIRFSLVRYANVFGSKGSVIPFFLKVKDQGYLPITHPEMTRFSITMQEAVDLVFYAIDNGRGGDIILPVSASYKIMDVAEAIAPGTEKRIVGIRHGEKMHETMYTERDSSHTVRRDNYFIICPPPGFGLWNSDDYCLETGAERVPENSACSSDRNTNWLDVKALKKMADIFLTE